MTWQSIESAPRDGRQILCWLSVGGYELTYRHRGAWRYGPKGHTCTPTHWQPLTPPTPDDREAFLAGMTTAAETGAAVTADDVARLRKMAGWPDAPPPPHWTGIMNKHEAARMIKAARERMRHE